MESYREQVIAAPRRRWRERDLTPLIPRFISSSSRRNYARKGRNGGRDEQGTGIGRHAEKEHLYSRRMESAKIWNVKGSFFGGWEMYHLKGSPVDPKHALDEPAVGFGQLIQRSNDGGETWEPVGNNFAYDVWPSVPAGNMVHRIPGSSSECWDLEPSLTDPDTVYAGIEDAAAIPLTMAAKSWQGAFRVCANMVPDYTGSPERRLLHTILLDPSDPGRGYIAISAAGAFRTNDGGATW